METSYNGYKNWHTWNTVCWLINDEDTYSYFDRVTRLFPKAFESEVRDFLKGIPDEIDPDLVDYDEVINAFNEI